MGGWLGGRVWVGGWKGLGERVLVGGWEGLGG